MLSHCQQRRRSIANKASRSIQLIAAARGGYICVIPEKKTATMNGETTTVGFKIQYIIFDNVFLNPLLCITNLTTSVSYLPDSSITTISFKLIIIIII